MKDLQSKIEELLNKKITLFQLKRKGACNNAYYIETLDGSKYIVKQELEEREFEPQNTLLVESRVVEFLYKKIFFPTPSIVFVSENSEMYGYEYIEGEMLKDVWQTFSEEEKINTCKSLGKFHSEIGRVVDRRSVETLGIKINESVGLHPIVEKEYFELIEDADVPEDFKDLVKKAKVIFDSTFDKVLFQFIHNDAHHENILIKNKNISGIIDFGETEYGEIAKEFSRYIRDFPNYVEYIISSYEKESGNVLSKQRLISNALLSGFTEIVEDYRKGGVDRENAEKLIAMYKEKLN